MVDSVSDSEGLSDAVAVVEAGGETVKGGDDDETDAVLVVDGRDDTDAVVVVDGLPLAVGEIDPATWSCLPCALSLTTWRGASSASVWISPHLP